MTVTDGDLIPAPVPDTGNIPFGEPFEVSGEEYARIMHRIGITEGEPGTTVSAFNSSI